jgi:hypothetical protein
MNLPKIDEITMDLPNINMNEDMSCEVALDILENNISSIKTMPYNVRDNENIMLYVVNKDGLLIIHGSSRIQNTKSIINIQR